MGNVWKGTSDEKLLQAELALLSHGGLKPERVRCSDVFLDDQSGSNPDLERYIHHIEVLPKDYQEADEQQIKSHEKEVLVLIHGYGIGAAMFYPILDDLSNYFRVFAIDLLGMGASGRPAFDREWEVEEAEEFFTKSIRQWAEKVGLDKPFYLAGHSMGGYISVAYSLQYPEQIKKLLLLSPVGVPHRPDEQTPEKVVERAQGRTRKFLTKTFLRAWESGFTPYSVLRGSGRFGASFLLNQYLKRRMHNYERLAPEEVNDMVSYLMQIQLRPASSEYALHSLLQVGAWAKNPLIDRIPLLTVSGIEVQFFYGELDWMDASGPLRLIQQQLVNGSLHVVKNADHHLFLNNPEGMVNKILLAVYGEMEANSYQESKDRDRLNKELQNTQQEGEPEEMKMASAD